MYLIAWQDAVVECLRNVSPLGGIERIKWKNVDVDIRFAQGPDITRKERRKPARKLVREYGKSHHIPRPNSRPSCRSQPTASAGGRMVG